MRSLLIIVFAVVACSAAAQSVPDMIAGAAYVPSPKALPAMTNAQWCRTVDAALENPNITPERRIEYIATGQAQHCPHQLFNEPQQNIAGPPPDFCASAGQALNNPAINKYAKVAILERMRNRGCLK
jgi:hypothetical protein